MIVVDCCDLMLIVEGCSSDSTLILSDCYDFKRKRLKMVVSIVKDCCDS